MDSTKAKEVLEKEETLIVEDDKKKENKNLIENLIDLSKN